MSKGNNNSKNLRNIVAKRSFNASSSKLKKTIKNKWMHLSIDVQKDACDPAFYQALIDSGHKANPEFINHLPILDNTAKNIAYFTEDIRNKLQNIWVYSEFSELKERKNTNGFSDTQSQPHHVSRQKGEPTIKKSQKSAVPENMAFFKKLKEDGVKGFIVTGFFADDCIYETVKNLRNMGFDITVAEDLIEAALPHRKSEGLDKIKSTGAKIQSKQHILNNLNTDPQKVTHIKKSPQNGRLSS